jgi:DIM1 family U5 snRNP protein
MWSATGYKIQPAYKAYNKINWALEDKQEMIDIIETVYRGARKGRGLVVSPKDYSTKYIY